MLWVEARIDGAGPFRLLVDTGCDALALSQHVADAVGLKALPNRTLSIIGSVADDALARLSRVERVESGGLKLEGLMAVVLADADLTNAANALGGRFDGVLGMAALKDLILEIDFPAHQVTAVRRGTGHYPAARAVPYRGNTPKVTVPIGGKPLVTLIDTGSGMDGFEIPDLDAVPLLYPKIKDDGGVLGVGKSTVRGESSQLAGTIGLGPITWVNPPVSKAREGRLGVDALNTWKLAIDQQAHLLYFLGEDLRRQWDEGKPSELRFKPGYHARLEGTGLRLLEVDAGGAFDLAGLRAGDVILTVGGVSAVDYVMNRAPPEIQNKKTQKMGVRRDSTEFETTVITGPGEGRDQSQTRDQL